MLRTFAAIILGISLFNAPAYAGRSEKCIVYGMGHLSLFADFDPNERPIITIQAPYKYYVEGHYWLVSRVNDDGSTTKADKEVQRDDSALHLSEAFQVPFTVAVTHKRAKKTCVFKVIDSDTAVWDKDATKRYTKEYRKSLK